MSANIAREMSRSEKTGAKALFIRNERFVAKIDAWIAKENAANPDRAPWTRTSLIIVAVNKKIGAAPYPVNFAPGTPPKDTK